MRHKLLDLKDAALAIASSSSIDNGTHGTGNLAFAPYDFAFVLGIDTQLDTHYVVGAELTNAHGFRLVHQILSEVLY
jgi:hypothetical protein